MRILSRNDLELIGERVYKAYRKLEPNEELYKVDPEKLAEDLLGLTVDYAHLSTNGKTLGVTSFSSLGVQVFNGYEGEEYYFLDGKTILIERDLKRPGASTGRRNFTTAHEASHHILKMLYPGDYGTERPHYYKLAPAGITDWNEWQADTLASCVLMPRELLEKAMFIFRLDKYLPVLHGNVFDGNYRKFKMIAEFLGVSRQALAIRMKTLGFIGEAHINESHYDFIL